MRNQYSLVMPLRRRIAVEPRDCYIEEGESNRHVTNDSISSVCCIARGFRVRPSSGSLFIRPGTLIDRNTLLGREIAVETRT